MSLGLQISPGRFTCTPSTVAAHVGVLRVWVLQLKVEDRKGLLFTFSATTQGPAEDRLAASSDLGLDSLLPGSDSQQFSDLLEDTVPTIS